MNYDFKKHISSKIFKVIAYASAEYTMVPSARP